MQIARSFKIAFSPRTAVSWCLGIIVLMSLVQFVLIDSIPAPIAVAYTIGNVLWFFALKLLQGVLCSLVVGRNLQTQPRFAKPLLNFFMGGEREKLPRFTMTLLGGFLIIAGTPLMFIFLAWHISNNTLPGVQ